MANFLRLGFLIMAILSAFAQSQDVSSSGNRYLDICSSIEKPVDSATAMDVLNSGTCQGFMLGLEDGVGFSLSALKTTDKSLSYLKGSLEDLGVCFPNGAELGQRIRVVLKYVRAHPEQAHLPSVELVVLALHDAFPCAIPRQGTPEQKQ